MLVDIYAGYFPDDGEPDLDAKDNQVAENIIGSCRIGPQRTKLISRFGAYAKAASTNGAKLPLWLSGAKRFMYLLKNLDSFKGEAA
jgi:hypothetical protein